MNMRQEKGAFDFSFIKQEHQTLIIKKKKKESNASFLYRSIFILILIFACSVLCYLRLSNLWTMSISNFFRRRVFLLSPKFEFRARSTIFKLRDVSNRPRGILSTGTINASPGITVKATSQPSIIPRLFIDRARRFWLDACSPFSIEMKFSRVKIFMWKSTNKHRALRLFPSVLPLFLFLRPRSHFPILNESKTKLSIVRKHTCLSINPTSQHPAVTRNV